MSCLITEDSESSKGPISPEKSRPGKVDEKMALTQKVKITCNVNKVLIRCHFMMGRGTHIDLLHL